VRGRGNIKNIILKYNSFTTKVVRILVCKKVNRASKYSAERNSAAFMAREQLNVVQPFNPQTLKPLPAGFGCIAISD
jgi:hypothetical protein